jgi:hypothetical protein
MLNNAATSRTWQMHDMGRGLVFALATALLAPTATAQQVEPPRPKDVRLNSLRDIHLAMELCWRANLPPLAQAVPSMRVTVRVSFTRSGEILGEPLFTFATPGVSTQTRALYQRAAANALGRCTPLPLTEGLGNAVAGSPRVFMFIDRRNEKRV